MCVRVRRNLGCFKRKIGKDLEEGLAVGRELVMGGDGAVGEKEERMSAISDGADGGPALAETAPKGM